MVTISNHCGLAKHQVALPLRWGSRAAVASQEEENNNGTFEGPRANG